MVCGCKRLLVAEQPLQEPPGPSATSAQSPSLLVNHAQCHLPPAGSLNTPSSLPHLTSSPAVPSWRKPPLPFVWGAWSHPETQVKMSSLQRNVPVWRSRLLSSGIPPYLCISWVYLTPFLILLLLLTHLLAIFPSILEVPGRQRSSVCLFIVVTLVFGTQCTGLDKSHCWKKINRLDFRKIAYSVTYLSDINY